MELETDEEMGRKSDELFDALITKNNLAFNTAKFIEELFEVGELLIKSLTKTEALKPRKEIIAAEIADLLLRGIVYLEHAGIEEDDVVAAYRNKLDLLHKSLMNGTLGSIMTITKVKDQ